MRSQASPGPRELASGLLVVPVSGSLSGILSGPTGRVKLSPPAGDATGSLRPGPGVTRYYYGSSTLSLGRAGPLATGSAGQAGTSLRGMRATGTGSSLRLDRVQLEVRHWHCARARARARGGPEHWQLIRVANQDPAPLSGGPAGTGAAVRLILSANVALNVLT